MSGGWRRVGLVARREWDQRARTTAFRISTLISILIVVAIIVVPEMYGGGVEPTRTVGLVGQSSSQLPALLRASGEQLGVTVETRGFGDEAAGRAALRSDDVSVLLVDEGQLVWNADVDDQLRTIVASAVTMEKQQQTVSELGLTADQAQALLQPPALPSRSLEPASKERDARVALAVVGLALLFTAIAFYGGFVLVGAIEEKSSRVVEVLLSRLRPTELLTGKIVGIGLVGSGTVHAGGGVGAGGAEAVGEHRGPDDDAEHDRVDRVLVHPCVRVLRGAVRGRRLAGLASGGGAEHPGPDHGDPARRVHLRASGSAVARRRRGGLRIVVPPDGPDGDDRPHGGRAASRCGRSSCRWR